MKEKKKIQREDVEKAASLSRLELGEAEADRFVNQLSDILEYMEKLNGLDINGVEPLTHVLDLSNVTRADHVVSPRPSETYLANAPRTRDGFFLVPPVIE